MNAAAAGDSVVPEGNICAAAMLECSPGNGAYPVSHSLSWHGGAHLIAPRDPQGNAEPVRAIADGTIVYVRQTDNTRHAALSYRGVRTDDGCVVIKHSTEIGEGDNAKVTFFSVYMHLQTVVALTVGKKIYRKDVIGIAGLIYGQRGQIHFEVVCSKANLGKLVGRTAHALTTSSGRKDAVFGDIWFKVPRGSQIFQREPHPYRVDDRGPPPCAHPDVQPQTGTPTTSDYVIRMRYERGDCIITTFLLRNDGSQEAIGSVPTSVGYEYALYNEASRLSAKYVELNHAAGCAYAVVPSPSAIYEILRFGRTIGSDSLPPNGKFGHWRKVKTPDASGWINLNRPEICVYSDADFPPWAGWSLIESNNIESTLCDSPTIKQWLDRDGDGHVTHIEAVAALNESTVRERMSKAICRFPSEWTKLGIEQRWGWLKQPHEALPAPLSADEFDKLKSHIETLSFWEEAKVNEPTLPDWNDCWHFPPKAFIEHFRKCGWLSESELAQCIPRRVIDETRDAHGLRIYPRSLIAWQTAGTRAKRFYAPLNGAARRYGISATGLRMAYFLANAIQETTYLTRTSELGGAGANYAPWYGRGVLQLTWEENYVRYGRFRGLSGPATSFRDSLEHDLWTACDSAGFYWISCAKSPPGGRDINKEADTAPSFTNSVLTNVCGSYDYPTHSCLTPLGTLPFKPSVQLERVARAVNTGSPNSTGAVNGLIPRTIIFLTTVHMLTDKVWNDGIFLAQKE